MLEEYGWDRHMNTAHTYKQLVRRGHCQVIHIYVRLGQPTRHITTETELYSPPPSCMPQGLSFSFTPIKLEFGGMTAS